MKQDNIRMLEETLRILNRGSYETNGKTVTLKLSAKEMERCHVLLPEDVREICGRDLKRPAVSGRCEYSCLRADSFEAAILQEKSISCKTSGSRPVLVLNFANPVNTGGGVYRGASAQEEDLCRRSTLLRSLESEHAQRYYRYIRGLNTHMGSDAMIFSPQVEIIRDKNGELLEDTVVAAVLTCAAPMICYGLEGMSEESFSGMFFNRIDGLLKCAAYFGYDRLVLGAWGCGAFGNDAALVSDLFFRALKEMNRGGLREKDLFRRIDFAVRSRDPQGYNYREFFRNFGGGNFYRGEDR